MTDIEKGRYVPAVIMLVIVFGILVFILGYEMGIRDGLLSASRLLQSHGDTNARIIDSAAGMSQ